MPFSFKTLQEEQKPWMAHNFGEHRSPHQPLMGMAEELGELTAAMGELLAAGEDKAAAGRALEDIQDALADFTIFAADYCTKKGWYLEEVYESDILITESDQISTHFGMVKHLGRVFHHQLKQEQGIRGTPEEHSKEGQRHLGFALRYAAAAAKSYEWELEGITEIVWAKVRLRDFKKNSRTGQASNVRAFSGNQDLTKDLISVELKDGETFRVSEDGQRSIVSGET